MVAILALDRIKASATGDLLEVTRQLIALDDPSLAHALDSIAGEIYASSTQLAALDGEAVMDVVRSELGQRVTRGDPTGRVTTPVLWGSDRRHVWVRLRGERTSFDSLRSTPGQGGLTPAHGADASTAGVTAGMDWSFADHWLAGAAGSYSSGTMSLNGLDERSDFMAPRAVGYVGYAQSRWRLQSGISVAKAMYDVKRQFQFAAIGPSGRPLFGIVDRGATGSPSGLATDVWVEGRFNVPLGSWDLQPGAGMRSGWFQRDAWSETGADSLSLTGPSQTARAMQGDVGLRLARAAGGFRPFAEGMYRRELLTDVLSATLALSAQPGGLFEVDGVALAPDSVVGRGGVMFLTDRAVFSVLYDVRHSESHTRQSLQFGVGF